MENKKEVRIITAKEARSKAETSEFLLRLAFRVISEAAARNECCAELCIDRVESSVVTNVKDVLKTNGYSVDYYTEEDPEGIEEPHIDYNVLVIKW